MPTRPPTTVEKAMSEKEQAKPLLIGGELFISVEDRFTNRVQPRQMPAKFLEHKGRLATTLIEKWGLIAGKPSGEDSAGRAQFALMEPAEIVERACETAEQAVEAFKRRGWVHDVPAWTLVGKEPDEED